MNTKVTNRGGNKMKTSKLEYALGYTECDAGSKRVVLYRKDPTTGEIHYVTSEDQTHISYTQADNWGEDQLRVIGLNYIEEVAPHQPYATVFKRYVSVLEEDRNDAILKVIGKGDMTCCLYSMVIEGQEQDYYYGDMILNEDYEIHITTLRNCESKEELHAIKMHEVLQGIERDYLNIMVDSLRVESLCTKGIETIRGDMLKCQKNGTD